MVWTRNYPQGKIALPVKTVGMPELERILDRVHEWTRAADAKTDVLVAIQAGVLAFLLPPVTTWWTNATMPPPRWVQGGIALGLAALVIGIYNALMALFPRTKNPHRLKSVTFFGDIAAWKLDEYRSKLDEITNERWREDLVTQIHASAAICVMKHHAIKVSVVFFVIGLATLALVRLISQAF